MSKRCSICNSVSDEDVETDIGDFIPDQHFVEDPSSKLHFICGGCEDVINEVRLDYELEDFYKEE